MYSPWRDVIQSTAIPLKYQDPELLFICSLPVSIRESGRAWHTLQICFQGLFHPSESQNIEKQSFEKITQNTSPDQLHFLKRNLTTIVDNGIRQFWTHRNTQSRGERKKRQDKEKPVKYKLSEYARTQMITCRLGAHTALSGALPPCKEKAISQQPAGRRNETVAKQTPHSLESVCCTKRLHCQRRETVSDDVVNTVPTVHDKIKSGECKCCACLSKQAVDWRRLWEYSQECLMLYSSCSCNSSLLTLYWPSPAENDD